MFSFSSVIRFGQFSCYAIFRLVFHTGRNLIWALNGTYWQAYLNRNRKHRYAQSAHVHRISARFKFDVLLGPATLIDFVLTHDKFVNPEYVLKENVSLYQVTSDTAIFVEVPEHIDVWRCDNGSFLRQAQFNFARRVITMSLTSFHALADKVGDPQAKLIFVQNTARCGSTLLVRIFEETGRCVAFAEPDALNAVASYAGCWEKEKLKRVTKDAVRLLCKPTKKVENVAAYLMKMTVMSIDGVPTLQEVYPDGSHLFMYRDCSQVVKSLVRVACVLPMLDVAFAVSSIHPALTIIAVKMIGLSREDADIHSRNTMHGATQLWCRVMDKYMNLRDKDVEIAGVAYEDIREDPDHAIRAILRYCGLPEEFAVKGLEALNKDAQGNSALSTSNLLSLKVKVTPDPETKTYMNASLKQHGYPPLGVTCIVPGTITHKGPIYWPPKLGTEVQNGTR